MVELNIHTDIRAQRGQYWLENIMKDKFAVSMFGQKRLSREGGIEIVVKELCTRMARDGCQVTCYNRSGHHVSGAEYDNKIEYDGIRQKFVPTIERKGLTAVVPLSSQLCIVLLESMMWFISMQKVRLFSHGCQRCLERES